MKIGIYGGNTPPLPSGVSIRIYEAGTATLATVYDPDTDTVIDQVNDPFVADADGRFKCEIASGLLVDLKIGGEGTAADASFNGGAARWFRDYSVSEPVTKTTSPTDTTAGRVLKVGDFGLGDSSYNVTDLNLLSTIRHVQATFPTTAINTPRSGLSGVVYHYSANDSVAEQFVIGENGNEYYFRRRRLSVWEPWQEIYHTGNILGTVSEASGVPTGAIIERGSNSDGEYVKFADGTMICTGQVSGIDVNTSTGSGVFFNGVVSFNLPAGFVNAGYSLSVSSFDADGWANAYVQNALSANIMIYALASATSKAAYFTAVGRCF